MKIGIDARMFSDNFTGIGRYNFEITKRIFAKFPKTEFVIFMNEPEFSKFNFPQNVRKILVNARIYSLAEQINFWRILHKEKCDLVHFTHFNVPILYRRPFITTIHDTTISFFPGKKMNTFFRKLAYRIVFKNAILKSKKIIAVSGNTKKDILKLFPQINSEKISVIYNGVGDDFSDITDAEKVSIKKKFKIKNDFLLYSGNWREHKNLVGLLTAFAEITKSEKNIDLVVTGKPDPFYPEVLHTIEKLNLSDRVHTVGLVDFTDLKNLFAAAKVFVFPSFYEGFGLPALEAMKSGTPVASSNLSSLPEVCGEAAVFFDPYNVEEMSKTILELWRDGDLQKKLVEKGRERVKNFSWDKCALETEVFLEI
jgi:glycosyltransferase involved in cell wall biosynthesis